MNTKNRYAIYFVYLLLAIPAVVIIFKFIEPKKLASLFAATVFISCSVLVMWGEWKNKSLKSFSFGTSIAFLVLFSAPMLIGRILHYDLDFSEINFGPLSGPEFHKYSNYAFMALLGSTVIDFLKTKNEKLH